MITSQAESTTVPFRQNFIVTIEESLLMIYEILYKWSNSPLQQMKLVAGVGIEPTQAFSVSRLWALHLTIRLPHDILIIICGPRGLWSPDLRLMRPLLSPTELWAQNIMRDIRELNPLREQWQCYILTVWPIPHIINYNKNIVNYTKNIQL